MRALALGLILVLSSSAAADEREVLRLRGWIDAVDRHAAGQADAALRSVTDWTYEDLELMRPYIEAFVQAPKQGNQARVRRGRNVYGSDAAAVGELTRSLQKR